MRFLLYIMMKYLIDFVNSGFIKIEIDFIKSIALSFDYDEEDGWWFPLPNLEELVKDLSSILSSHF